MLDRLFLTCVCEQAEINSKKEVKTEIQRSKLSIKTALALGAFAEQDEAELLHS